MKRALLLVAVFIICLGIALALFWRRGAPVSPFYTASPSAVLPPVGATGAKSGSPGLPGATANSAGSAPPRAAPDVSPVFLTFLNTDAKLLESTHVDSAAAEAREQRQADAMLAPEIHYARELALSRQAPANQRILAVDLLTRANFKLALPALTDLITRGMNSARAEPHSVDELSNTQAKAFAVMAVDKLVAEALHDPSAREELIRMSSLAKDSTIQKYIADKIRTLPPLR